LETPIRYSSLPLAVNSVGGAGGLDPATGVFTAPVSGVYQASFTAQMDNYDNGQKATYIYFRSVHFSQKNSFLFDMIKKNFSGVGCISLRSWVANNFVKTIIRKRISTDEYIFALFKFQIGRYSVHVGGEQ
jgi:hypothetical protein